MTREVWFQLVDGEGNAVARSADRVKKMPNNAVVVDVRDAVKLKCANTLAEVDAVNLTVFAHRKAYDLKQALPKSSSPLTDIGKDEDHPLIVQVSMPRQVDDKPQIDWTVTAERCPQLLVKDEDRVIELPPYCVAGSGIGRSGRALTLYRRTPLVEQWKEINRCSIQTYAHLWIVGPPGTGKSCAALAFAWSLDRLHWEVMWIHYSRRKRHFNCVWLQGGKKTVCVVKEETVERDLAAILKGTSQTRKTIVFLDGYVKNTRAGEAAYLKCLRWNQEDKIKHRLVCVCSMVSIGKTYRPELYDSIENVDEKLFGMVEDLDEELSEVEDVDMETGESYSLEQAAANASSDIQTSESPHTTQAAVSPVDSEMLFELTSWLVEEYEEAILCDEFFRAVVGMFPEYSRQTDPAKEKEERISLLQAKYFVAGGSARLMFERTAEKGIEALTRAIATVPNIENYLNGLVGESSGGAVNRLLARYYSPPPQKADVRLVSDYVVRTFAIQMGPRLLEKFAGACAVNPSMDGWILEAWFFAELSHKGLTWSVCGESELQRHQWEKSVIVYFDPSRYPLVSPLKDPAWMAPVKWNQGGYDAVYIDKAKQLVRFVQVTRAKRHTFKEKYFVDLLHSFIGDHVNQVAAVELYFVVPMNGLRTFRLPVSKQDFKKNVVDVASPASQSTANVMAIGVAYETTNFNPVEGAFVG